MATGAAISRNALLIFTIMCKSACEASTLQSSGAKFRNWLNAFLNKFFHHLMLTSFRRAPLIVKFRVLEERLRPSRGDVAETEKNCRLLFCCQSTNFNSAQQLCRYQVIRVEDYPFITAPISHLCGDRRGITMIEKSRVESTYDFELLPRFNCFIAKYR